MRKSAAGLGASARAVLLIDEDQVARSRSRTGLSLERLGVEQQVNHAARKGAGFEGYVSVGVMCVAAALVEADGAWVVVYNAQNHAFCLLMSSLTLACCNKAGTESTTPLVLTYRQIAELPLSRFCSLSHRVTVGKGGDRSDDVGTISEHERLV